MEINGNKIRNSETNVDESLHITSENSEKKDVIPNINNLPKYYPREHELTKWLINQMRRRNGLHHLINFANLQPNILSAHFELLDQPDHYLDSKEGTQTPAYSSKTVLFLTPLAIAVYLGYRSVIQLLLDNSGTKLQPRVRKHVDVNATCYAKRQKPKVGLFGTDDYFTTSPVILGIRREFYSGISLMMGADFKPQSKIFYVEHVGSNQQTTHWMIDAMEYAVRLLTSRPGLDIVHLFQVFMYPNNPYADTSLLDVMTYDVYLDAQGERQPELWYSLFRRLCRKGVSIAYSNCSNRLINLLELLEKCGFFRQEYMPKGTIEYDINFYRNRARKNPSIRKFKSSDIMHLNPNERDACKLAIGVDRDVCIALLTAWLNRMRNRCMEKQAKRLMSILLASLVDTELLTHYLFAPTELDTRNVIWPTILDLAIGTTPTTNTHWMGCSEDINIFNEDAYEQLQLEPIHVHELRMDLAEFAYNQGHINHKLLKKLVVKQANSQAENRGDIFCGQQSNLDILKIVHGSSNENSQSLIADNYNKIISVNSCTNSPFPKTNTTQMGAGTGNIINHYLPTNHGDTKITTAWYQQNENLPEDKLSDTPRSGRKEKKASDQVKKRTKFSAIQKNINQDLFSKSNIRSASKLRSKDFATHRENGNYFCQK